MTDLSDPTVQNSLLPANEVERLAALHRYDILDTPTEVAFDRVTSLAARLFQMPTVLISLVDKSRAWFKSSIGFEASEVPRDATLCSFAVLTDELLVVPDTQLDQRFLGNPFVQCEPGLRFYAGAPLLTHDGFNLGTLCMLDTVPHNPLTAEQEATLVDLAAIVIDELELRLSARQIAKVDAALLEITRGLSTVTGGEFMEALVQHLAKILNTDYAYIGLIEGDDPKMMRTIATYASGQIVDNLEYKLEDTPCWKVIKQRRICCYPRNVQSYFPNAPLLKPLLVESYAATSFFDARGEVLGVLGVMDGKPLQDVHLAESLLIIFSDRIATEIDRQQAELALRASEERYKALIEITAQIVWNTNANGKMLYANSGLFTGQSFEESEGEGWMQAIHPDDRRPTIELWLLAVANLTPYQIEHRVRRYDGEYRLMSGRAVPLLNNDGSVREWVGLHTDITEVRQDEQNLRRSEEFNRRILENNQDCIKVLDLEGRLIYMNDGGKRLLEIDDFADYDRSLWTQFWGGSEQNSAQIALEAAMAGAISKFEGQCPTVTGVPKWWDVNVIPLHNEDGNVDQILLISHDLTERRQAEEELRQSQALAQSQLMEIEAIYQTAPIGMAIIDVDLRFQRVNQRLAEINGVTIADHLGRTVRDVLGDLADGNEPLLRQVLETGEPVLDLELSGETKAHPGIYRTWISNFYPLNDPTGQTVGINVVVQEITAAKRAEGVRKVAEAALLESEDRFRSTFEQAAVGIAHVALDGRWLLVNPKLCEICGYTSAELLGGYFQDITHPDDLAQDQESIRQILADEIQLIALEKRYIHKLGHIIWISLTGMLRREASGAPLYFITSIENITYRKQAEFSLQAQAVKLAETTALVELRNQELNLFSHTVSHDLKAPLRGISNLAGWIQEDLPATVDPDILANLELMRSRISRMDSLIDGLLNYAKVGNTEASLETFSVEQLLSEIIDSLSIPDRFVVELPTELPSITTHRVLLNQVLANLIGNAYKHHDRSDGRIQITVQPDGEIWRFSVTDDGAGIAPENQERVFDIFKTLSGNDKTNTGIGLSIVKKLVETHGGTITLESQIGMGTTFNFSWIAEI
jgi:PAS domain S-box-containing protein